MSSTASPSCCRGNTEPKRASPCFSQPPPRGRSLAGPRGGGLAQTGKGNRKTNVLNLRCPICARADGIQIRAQTWVAITDVGNRPFPPEWEKDSQAICDGCDHSGTVEQ